MKTVRGRGGVPREERMQGTSEKVSPDMIPFQYPSFWLGETSWQTLVFKNKLFLGFFFFLAVSHATWDLSSPARDRTRAHCSGSTVLTTGLPGKVPGGELMVSQFFSQERADPSFRGQESRKN